MQWYDRHGKRWLSARDLQAGRHTISSTAPETFKPATPSLTRKVTFALHPPAKLAHAVPDGLAEVAHDHIVRGGAWGLTGNAILVTRAQEVLEDLQSNPGTMELVQEGEELVEAWREWKEAVKQRRRLPMGLPPPGMSWVIPGTTTKLGL